MRIPKNIALALITFALSAKGDNFSFTGTFTQDDNVQPFNFTVAATSNVTLVTYSYAGGVNAAGQTIASDGFDPILALFDSTGALIGQNDDGGSNVPADPETGQQFDTYLNLPALAAGSYTVTIIQYNNFANGPNLSDGFAQAGQGNFTSAAFGNNGPGSFYDVSGIKTMATGRSIFWA
jgi:hypothetical protein